MASGQASLFAPHPEGFPGAFVAGRTVAFRFFVPGKEFNREVEVPAKERQRARIIQSPGKKAFAQWYTPKKTVDWEEHVGEQARAQLLSLTEDFTLPQKDCRVIMQIRFNVRKPKSYPASVRWPVKKPDLDNLVKAVLDGMVNGRIIEDDNCITDLQTMKRYAEPGHPVGVEVDVTCLPT